MKGVETQWQGSWVGRFSHSVPVEGFPPSVSLNRTFVALVSNNSQTRVDFPFKEQTRQEFQNKENFENYGIIWSVLTCQKDPCYETKICNVHDLLAIQNLGVVCTVLNAYLWKVANSAVALSGWRFWLSLANHSPVKGSFRQHLFGIKAHSHVMFGYYDSVLQISHKWNVHSVCIFLESKLTDM